MPEIVTTHLTHIYWALVCLLVAVLVHFWPTIKTWWAARAAAAEAEGKRAKALAELAAVDVESLFKRIEDAFDAKVKALEAKAKDMESRIDARVAADALKVAAAVDPATDPASAPAAPEIVTIPAATPVRSLIPSA
jgi:flagellar biosynthesis/type III secretory pathway M-ring protein FliF/YscJ